MDFDLSHLDLEEEHESEELQDLTPFLEDNDLYELGIFGQDWKKAENNLIQHDYTLCSPLLEDKLTAAINGFREKEGEVNKIHDDAVNVGKLFRSLMDGDPVLKDVKDLHRWAAREVYNCRGRKWSDSAKRFGELWSNESDVGYVPLDAYMSGIMKKNVTLKNDKCFEWMTNPSWECEQMRWDLQLTLELTSIVYIINSENERELKYMTEAETLNVEINHETGVRSMKTSWGLLRYKNGLLHFPRENVMIGRNFLLMLKDVSMGRFGCKVGLCNRMVQTIDERNLESLSLVFKTGDRILEITGNRGFKIIKMWEPHCVGRLAQLAEKIEDIIQPAQTFLNYLKDTRALLSEDFRTDVTQWFDLVMNENNYHLVNYYHGVFRLWGHPFIQCEEGLNKLRSRVCQQLDIDQELSEKVASDMAFMILKKQYCERSKWYVDLEKMDPQDALYEHVEMQKWPAQPVIQAYGDKWHLLPLTACFELPSEITPSVLYSDKSYSPNLQELCKHKKEKPLVRFPSKKVLKTALTEETVDIKSFLQNINDNGLDKDDLVIGLKPKERELNPDGRYFSLMTWVLRLYFVITEYLIKECFLGLFDSITMKDDLLKIFEKMYISSAGQGDIRGESRTISNLIDYEKWNNYQRMDSNKYVFKVMGEALGLPHIFERTHEFFEKSLIYYPDRPDMIDLNMERTDLINKDNTRKFLWRGQLGGLEGLRQKGWTILSLLVVRQASRVRNTKVTVMAQGDNQVICTHYKMEKGMVEGVRLSNLTSMLENNEVILKEVIRLTGKIGLLVNKSETLTSSQYTDYGKVVMFQGHMIGAESKTYARMGALTNDQIPSLSTVMSSVSTGLISLAQRSDTIIQPLTMYPVFSVLVLLILSIHNPLTLLSFDQWRKRFVSDRAMNNVSFQVKSGHMFPEEMIFRALYLDPSVGGVCGTSVARFFIRAFPDPITEALSFWKIVYDNTTNEILRRVACAAGFPKIMSPNIKNLEKLLEDPACLNVKKGINASAILQEAVKKGLKRERRKIKSKLFLAAVDSQTTDKERLISFLHSIKPRFPRFLSEFFSSTFPGLMLSLCRLFQNGKTTRKIFSRSITDEVAKAMEVGESLSLLSLCKVGVLHSMWKCSTIRADELRTESWGETRGSTVPHPSEMFGCPLTWEELDRNVKQNIEEPHITVHYPSVLDPSLTIKGSRAPYLGSKTTDPTNTMQPWEKITEAPLLRRACKLRNAINWFVEPESKLAKGIYEVLKSLSGEDWAEEGIVHLNRTGHAYHRFSCSRYSSAGFISTNPNLVSFLSVTSDTMSSMGGNDYTFMYQSSLLWVQGLSVLLNLNMGRFRYPSIHMSFIECNSCVQEITNEQLEANHDLNLPDRSSLLRPLSTATLEPIKKNAQIPMQISDLSRHPTEISSFWMGVTVGFMHSAMKAGLLSNQDSSPLFPLAIKDKFQVPAYLSGVCTGVFMTASHLTVYAEHKRGIQEFHDKCRITALTLISQISREPGLQNLLGTELGMDPLLNSPARIPASYPANPTDRGRVIRDYMMNVWTRSGSRVFKYLKNGLWIFPEMYEPKAIFTFVLSWIYGVLIDKENMTNHEERIMISLKTLEGEFKSPVQTGQEELSLHIIDTVRGYLGLGGIKFNNLEMKKLFRKRCVNRTYFRETTWSPEVYGRTFSVPVEYSTMKENLIGQNVSRCSNPTISGLRLGQLATGAHYKLRSILKHYNIHSSRFLVCGDGSGGMTSCCLRMFPESKGWFNSLPSSGELSLQGCKPQGPAAVEMMHHHIKSRCVNRFSCWRESSDLRDAKTWRNLDKMIKSHGSTLDLIVIDAEDTEEDNLSSIFASFRAHMVPHLNEQCVLIIKMYGTSLRCGASLEGLESIGSLYEYVDLVNTEYSSSFTSEMYMVCRKMRSETGSRVHPTRDSIDRAMSACFASSQIEPEFRRALTIARENTLQGIELNKIPTLEIEILGFVSSLNMNNKKQYEVTKMLLACNLSRRKDLITRLMCILHIIVDGIFMGANWSDRNSIPNNTDINNVENCMMGFYIVISLLTEDPQLWAHCHRRMNSHVSFHFAHVVPHCKERHRKKVNQKGLKQLVWSNTNPLTVEKKIHRHPAMERTGQLIRLLRRSCDIHFVSGIPSGSIDETEYLAFMNKHNSGLSWEQMLYNTGMLDVCQESPESGKIIGACEIDPTDNYEKVWEIREEFNWTELMRYDEVERCAGWRSDH